MSPDPIRTIRLHLVPTVFLATFVVVLATVTIAVSMTKFKRLADESTQTVFSLIAQRNADELQTMLSGAVVAVEAQSSLEAQRVAPGGQIDQTGLVPVLVATLRANPRMYSLYYGMENGAFLQVIAVRSTRQAVASLQVPPGTDFAVQYINPESDPGPRQEHWRFLSSNETVLAQSARMASYIPRSRPWYIGALTIPDIFVTDPYGYHSVKGKGITLARALPGGKGVFGADLALGGFDSYAAASLEGREGGLVVTDARGTVMSAFASQRFDGSPLQALQPISASTNPLFVEAATLLGRNVSRVAEVAGDEFAFASRSVAVTPAAIFNVVTFAPMDLYTGAINRARNGIVLFAVLMLLIFLPLTDLIARRIVGALGTLTAESERIQLLDFSGEKPVRSMFYEIDLLGTAQHTMRMAIRERTQALDEALARLESLLESGTQLASRRSQDTVLQQTLDTARRLVDAQAGQFWLCTDYGTLRLAAELRENGEIPPPRELEIPIAGAATDPCVRAVVQSRPVLFDVTSSGFDLSVQHALLGSEPRTLLAVPVMTHGHKPIGVLVLTHALERGNLAEAFDPQVVRYAETLAAQSGVALDNIVLFDSQRVLMESLLQLLAGAIDAKSAYTGSHCARVPELARMLAEAACEVDDGPLAAFRFETEEEWREFRIGTWLHDCGKVTTPEYVVDKATKLETIFNRIHEIRTRFEVLLRDAEIARLTTMLAGGNEAAAREAFETRRTQLADDFAFIAACNIGAESMDPAHAERLRTIGEQTWLRHFDDRLGLSHVEESRVEKRPPTRLPAVEQLLADKPEHIVPRTAQQRYDARYGFRLEVPEHLYNFGELHNLSVSRGTLTAEERYKINEHIIQTIVMLDQLPLPPNLQRVPEYASTHHETLTGSGYPRGLSGDALSVPARIMAIADIFEALTASDRPYKKAKPLSEAVRLLASFKQRGHIDADLFNLFLQSGVYLRYAKSHLPPEQIDEVDIEAYVGA